jgi:hypothetical protein
MEKQQKHEAQQKKTGATNLEFDLFSEVHSLLKGCAALDQYIEDAREAGDREAEALFKSIRDQNKENVAKVRNLVAKHMHTEASA